MSMFGKRFLITTHVPMDTSCEAEYEDGFVLNETEHNDESIYTPIEVVGGVRTGANIFSDIVNGRPEAEHGKMVRFSVFYKGQRNDMLWSELPANARPIRFRDASMSLDDKGNQIYHGFHAVRWGFQYTDENGKNQQYIEEL